MQLIYLTDIFEDNIVRDRFGVDSVNMMKNRPLVAKKQRKFQYILAWLYQKTIKIVTRNSNTQSVREPYRFVTNSRET